MIKHETLRQKLKSLDGRDYGAYQSLVGEYSYPDFVLFIDRVQKDPYAPPSTGIFRVRVARERASIPTAMTDTFMKEVALRDFLARQFYSNCQKISKGRRGTGHSGLITLAKPEQAILERSSMVITNDFVEVRFFIGFPARGRAISAKTADTMLFEELPQIVRLSLFTANLCLDDIDLHIKTAEDTDYLRQSLRSLGLVAFIADGASLPRASGIDPKPLKAQTVVTFQSPERLRIKIDLPHAGTTTGMGVPKGVTLIVGGGYHGKSTVLKAIELGIYNHIPGDGRERCASLSGTVKVRASSGRYVVKTDISTFINNLPLEKNTTEFSTENASGSTSQAASISEAIEAGAEVLLMDEDTCAANFMIRDRRMQQLVTKKNEPITSFIDKIRQLYDERGVSTVLVMGGSGDYFDVADHIIHMIEFIPQDVTEKAHEICENFPTGRAHEGGKGFGSFTQRIPLADSLDPYNEYHKIRIGASDPHKLIFGKTTVDLSDVEQIIERAQTKAIGRAIYYARKYMDGEKAIREIIHLVMDDIDKNTIDILDKRLTGDLARFREQEFAAALNRLRGFDVKQIQSE
jgi:predicted ABC-class ATPase